MTNLRLSFSILEKEELVALHTSDMKHRFAICERKGFTNSTIKMESDNGFLFDGYSTWFHGGGEFFSEFKDFTVTLVLAPMSFETGKSGLLTKYNANDKTGFYIAVRKLGIVTVGFGTERDLFEFESIKQHLHKNKWNTLSVVFNCTAGWCDLYVNGQISNRKQFPRHSVIQNSESECYIGKFVDNKDSLEATKTGIYDGYIEFIDIYDAALSSQELFAVYFSKSIRSETIVSGLDRKDYKTDSQRPQYHLIAPGKWMNEPHAPLYFEGYYHIFYQTNPHAPLFDNIQWGHMISTDMVHWRDLMLALETEDNNLDPDGCWSGSSCVDKQGIPTIFYTAGNNDKFPNQGIAMAKADISKDSKLEYWVKKETLIVEQTHHDGWMGEFRDPFVWLQDDTYYMLVGTGAANNGGGNALIYSSDNLSNWTNHGFVMDYDYSKNMELGHVWELPVILPVKDETGKIIHHAFLLCACQIENSKVETYYWIGDWDSKSKRFNKLHEKAKLIDLGDGIFTGASGFVTPDGRSVVFTIAQGNRNWDEEFRSGWAHNGGIPIELFYKDNQLGIKPIEEIYSLKHNKLLEVSETTVVVINEQLSNIKGNLFYATIETDANYVGISTIYGDESVEVYYDKDNCLYASKKEKTDSINSTFRGDIDKVDIGEGSTRLEYFLDHSMIEVYLNNLKSISLRNYSKDKSRRVKLMGDDNAKIISFVLWEMKSVYE